MIKKPMKAPTTPATVEDLKNMQYPIACSPKLDGIRGIITELGVLSNSMKPLGNQFMQRELGDPRLIGLDGELIVGSPHKDLSLPDDDVFNRTTGAIRRASGEPDFTFYVFDYFRETSHSYWERWLKHIQEGRNLPDILNNVRIKILDQRICHNVEEALAYEAQLIEMGYEGMMPRSIFGHYKQGRATLNERLILKRKPLEQDEAVVVDIFEQMQNNNEKGINEMGDSFRSSHKENLVGKGTLGGVVLKSSRWKDTFNCGTIIGGTDKWRQEMWDNPERILGKTMTYIYQGYGSIDKPRQPRAKAEFRLDIDLEK